MQGELEGSIPSEISQLLVNALESHNVWFVLASELEMLVGFGTEDDAVDNTTIRKAWRGSNHRSKSLQKH